MRNNKTAENEKEKTLKPPKAGYRPFIMKQHGCTRTDGYHWLREKDSPAVKKYLRDENIYADNALRSYGRLSSLLAREFKARIKKKYSTVPFLYGNYLYRASYSGGKEYPVFSRKKAGTEEDYRVILDVNVLAEGKDFCDADFPEINGAGDKMAFAVDTEGDGVYTVYFKDLFSGETLPDRINGVSEDIVWAADGKTLLYVKTDPETLRWAGIMAHTLGGKEDREIYYEPDDAFEVSVSLSETEKYIFIRSGSSGSTEYRLLDASEPFSAPLVFSPRKKGLEYELYDGGDIFYILNNDGAPDFKLSSCKMPDTDISFWKTVVPGREGVLIEYADVYEKWIVLKECSEARGRLRVISRRGKDDRYILSENTGLSPDCGDNFVYSSEKLRVEGESMTEPGTVYEVDMRTGSAVALKKAELPGKFRPDDYVSERLFFTARDGAKVPMSIAYKKGTDLKSGKNPVHIYAYGAYGCSTYPYFSLTRLSLLDRGFVCAIAHVRGGSERGRAWYDGGRLLDKKNSFYDFIDAAEFLIDSGCTSAGRVYAEGASAGGLLVCAAANMAPELYGGVIAEVPFVDILTSMSDRSLPLTTVEYEEWGDPREEKYYRYILSYSPYDNIKAQNYPAMFVTAGLNDSRVQYWEPAKWTAKLRSLKTDDNKLILKTEMSAGHQGRSGRTESLKLTAAEYAFIIGLEEENLKKRRPPAIPYTGR